MSHHIFFVFSWHIFEPTCQVFWKQNKIHLAERFGKLFDEMMYDEVEVLYIPVSGVIESADRVKVKLSEPVLP